MRRSLRRLSSRRGTTLPELLIAITVSAILIWALSESYFVAAGEFERQQGEGDALLATAQACSRIADYAAVSMSAQMYTRFGLNDTLCLQLPADTAYGIYVPGPVGVRLLYRPGQRIVFYLSNSTGSYLASGSILWSGTVTSLGPPLLVTPDATWSLYPGSSVGRITPVDTLQFSVDILGDYPRVTITAQRSYRVGRTSKTLTVQRTACLRNTN